MNQFRWWACLILLNVAAVSSGFAQVANNTSLLGTVTDATGNVIVGASVTILNEGTNETFTVVTNNEGYYAVKFIRPGTYDLTVQQQGFDKLIQKGIVVQTNQAVRTDVMLKVGSVTESLTVESATPAIATDDATISETLNTRSVSDLPLNGRDALKLATTSSDVILGPKSSNTGIPPGEDFIGAGQR